MVGDVGVRPSSVRPPGGPSLDRAWPGVLAQRALGKK